MKIAVISDIHGNMEALEAVLEDIKNNECDKIFALGDYAMAGPEPKRVVDFVINNKNNSKYIFIQGNTDLMIADYNDELAAMLQEKAPTMGFALQNDITLLSNEEKMFLKSLPIQKDIVEDGIKILLVHGSPRKNNEDILPDTPISEVEKMISGTSADLILCGHTHIPCGFQTSTKQTVVNVGSVGRPFTPEPKACYLIIEIENGKYQLMHHFVNYNKEAAAAKLDKRNFFGSDKLAKTLLNPQQRHF